MQEQPDLKKICSEFGLSPLMATILCNRGYDQIDDISEYLGYSMPKFNPLEVDGMTEAIKRIRKALDSGERILVYGDYDVDGITGAAILYSYLSQYNPDRHYIDFYVPDRIRDGYGLTEKGIRRLAETGFEGLVVTVDNGVSAYHEVELAKSLGRFEVVITDHHDLPSDKPWPDTWFVNPKKYGQFPEMSGAGVAHMVCCAMDKLWPTPKGVNWLMDLVAIGTVADMCPLVGINRTLVKYGMNVLNKKIRVGIYSLLNAGGFDFNSGPLNTETIGFRIGPCLNAAGRIDNPTQCVELLITEDMGFADKIAWDLYELNEKRKLISKETVARADAMAKQLMIDNPTGVIIISAKDFHPGIVGLSAAKIVEKYNRPVIMLHEKENGELAGSARTTLDFDIREGLSKASDLLGRWGGHAGAAGLSVTKENLAALQENLNKQFIEKRQGREDLITRHPFDAEIYLRNVNADLMKQLEIFEPTGMANPSIYFRSSELWVTYDKLVGKVKPEEHLQFRVSEGNWQMKGIAFFSPHLFPLPRNKSVEICYKPAFNYFQGRMNVELMAKEIFW
jgi:single-stranded-DNA-specific exonuclease